MDNIEPLEVNALWAMSGTKLNTCLAQMERMMAIDPEARMEIRKAQEAGLPINAVNGSAEIRIMGPLTKRMSVMSYFAGGTSYLQIKAALNAAVVDNKVSSILLHIDSPGGSVSGMKDAADAIRAASTRKPVTAYIDGMGASAAYYLASHASEIYAVDKSEVGSIGVYAVLYDTSEAFKAEGIKAIPVSTSDMKLIGAPGVEITDEMKAEVQKHIDAWGDEFFNAVQANRRMTKEQADNVTNGKVFMAEEARALGLIDGIDSLENVRALLAGRQEQMGRARTARAKVARMRMDA